MNECIYSRSVMGHQAQCLEKSNPKSFSPHIYSTFSRAKLPQYAVSLAVVKLL